jgi:hypothetical protein
MNLKVVVFLLPQHSLTTSSIDTLYSIAFVLDTAHTRVGMAWITTLLTSSSPTFSYLLFTVLSVQLNAQKYQEWEILLLFFGRYVFVVLMSMLRI